MRLLKIFTSILFIIIIVLYAYAVHWKEELERVKMEKDITVVKLDSLKTENKLLTSQLGYLVKFYDSTKRKIPQPTGFAFIADSISAESIGKSQPVISRGYSKDYNLDRNLANKNSNQRTDKMPEK